MRYRTHFELLLLGTLLLTSCVPLSTPSEPAPSATPHAQWDCAEVIDAKLESFPFRASGDAVRVWIQDQYKLTTKDVRSDLSADGAQFMLEWNPPTQGTYDVTLWNDTRESAAVWERWSEQAPTLADALRCLGDPLLYRAYHAMTPGGIWTYLELWYPERGIMVTAFVTRKTSGMTTHQAVADITYVQPGLPDDLITRFFWAITRGEDRYVEILEGLRSWPGDIGKITIDERG